MFDETVDWIKYHLEISSKWYSETNRCPNQRGRKVIIIIIIIIIIINYYYLSLLSIIIYLLFITPFLCSPPYSCRPLYIYTILLGYRTGPAHPIRLPVL